jgi:hypothetical protein
VEALDCIIHAPLSSDGISRQDACDVLEKN